jgi:hypothetical protein
MARQGGRLPVDFDHSVHDRRGNLSENSYSINSS